MIKDEILFKETDGLRPQAVLVSVTDDERSFDELELLLDTAGGECFCRVTQVKDPPDKKYCIGSGKASEIAGICKDNGIELVIFDNELSPSQIANLEELMDGVRVIDRTMLILDIFALHAVSAEGKLQVELARLSYTLPRLSGKGIEMSRLGGGIGTRGPGESKLEEDKRDLRRKIDAVRRQLAELAQNRDIQRKRRERSGVFSLCIAGYTNAGKSTLLNSLTGAGVLAENKLFATLDSTTRRFALPCGEEILVTDTVGFIRNLPHHLINAFRSTLDEVSDADAVLIVCDASDPDCDAETEVTRQTLYALGAAEKPVLCVYNKCDMISDGRADRFYISAKTGEGLPELVAAIERLVLGGRRRMKFFFPHGKGGYADLLYKNGVDVKADYRDDGVEIEATVDIKIYGMLKEFAE